MSAQQERRGIEGIILDALPRGLYRVQLDDGKRITAALGATARRVTVKVIPGDRVTVEVSPYDPTRGSITGRIG